VPGTEEGHAPLSLCRTRHRPGIPRRGERRAPPYAAGTPHGPERTRSTHGSAQRPLEDRRHRAR
jgi:hypothetical protein